MYWATLASRSKKQSFPPLGMHEVFGALRPGVGPQYANTGEDPEEGHQDGYRSGAHDVQREAEGSAWKRGVGGDLTTVLNYLKKGKNREDGARLIS